MFSRQPAPPEAPSLTFAQVFAEEVPLIAEARKKRGVSRDQSHVEKDLIGLAFSGGGIRSATFNLGVLQALAQHKILRSVDYLSTVSGGGYIGSWLTSWGHALSKGKKDAQIAPPATTGAKLKVVEGKPTEPAKGAPPDAASAEAKPEEKKAAQLTPSQPAPPINHIAEIEALLQAKAARVGEAVEPDEIYFLRKYSNYLTPHLGILSGDTLAFIFTYLRNALLNFMVLISALLCILLVPRLAELLLGGFGPAKSNFGSTSPATFEVLSLFALPLLLVLCFQILNNTVFSKGYSPLAVEWLIALPLFVFCLVVGDLIWVAVQLDYVPSERTQKILLVFWMGVIYAAIWVMAVILAVLVFGYKKIRRAKSEAGLELPGIPGWRQCLYTVLWAFPSGLVGGVLILVGIRLLQHWSTLSPKDGGIQYFVAYGIPLTVAGIMLVGIIHIGLIGRTFADGLREWWARLDGAVLAYALYWFLLAVVMLLLAPGIVNLFRHPESYSRLYKLLSGAGISGSALGWFFTTAKGLLAAKSDRTGPRPERGDTTAPSRAEDILAQVAPKVFVVGLIVILAVIMVVLGTNVASIYRIAVAFVLLAAFSLGLGARVDVNEFSLHNAYRNRLVRCYLGATNKHRHAQPFTGFDEADNIYLASVRDLAMPFHILNATLNVVKGRELALQARKARPFMFSPLYSGFEYTGDAQVSQEGSYRRTEECSLKSRYPGVRLGTAMAISGAAASPNMGHYTTGAVSFLLTIFCVRLGWWLGNPKNPKAWESGWPKSSWAALMSELTGDTNDDNDEIYLSDGGHFENLGVYELIRRRCRVIVASDAGADPRCDCNDLASLIEKCRVDFGADIQIALESIRPFRDLMPGGQSLRVSKSPFVVGSIHYADGSAGILIYIKPSLNTDLPQDVLAYARLAQTFPHQSTADQWFDEAQFESYRSLGFACAQSAICAIKKAYTGECADDGMAELYASYGD